MMEPKKDFDQKLDLLSRVGASALGQYAITCLIYADKNEELEGKKRFRFGPGGATAEEYLLFRVIDELVEHGFIEESFEIVPLMHREEFSSSVWSIPMRYIIKNNLQTQYEQQLDVMLKLFSESNLVDVLTASEFCSGFKHYEKGLDWLEKAINLLQVGGINISEWERFTSILSSYPVGDKTLKLALLAWDKIKSDIGMAKYYIAAYLTLFEGRSKNVDLILANLLKHPEEGALVSFNDLAFRKSAGLWLNLDKPQKAVQTVERIVDPNYKRYAQADLLRYVDMLVQQEHLDKAEALLQAMDKSLDWYLSKIESEKTKSKPEHLPESSSTELTLRAQSLLAQAVAIGKRPNISKIEAMEQIGILETLLQINQLTEAWEVVDLLVDTLEKVPAFSKHEFRARDVSKLLEKYHRSHPQILYKFTAELIKRDAKRGYWQTAHGISATLQLIAVLGGAKPLVELAQFLSNWPNGEIDNQPPSTL